MNSAAGLRPAPFSAAHEKSQPLHFSIFAPDFRVLTPARGKNDHARAVRRDRIGSPRNRARPAFRKKFAGRE
jgi:hypothetical protein